MQGNLIKKSICQNSKGNKEMKELMNAQTKKKPRRLVNTRVKLPPYQFRMIDSVRDEIMHAIGYIVRRKRECDWTRERSSNDKYVNFVKQREVYENKMNALQDSKGLIPVGQLLEKIKARQVAGIAFVDIYTPEYSKEYYKQFAPIIKHASVQLKDIGAHMQKVASKLNLNLCPNGRRMVIDSYFGENIGLTCELLCQLLQMGLMVTNIHSFIRYKPFPLFKPFVDKITKLRMQGDKDKSKAIIIA